MSSIGTAIRQTNRLIANAARWRFAKLRRGISGLLAGPRASSIIYDVCPRGSATAGRALIVGGVRAFLIDEHSREFFRHQSVRRCRMIATILADLGYVVDVASADDVKFGHIRKFKLAEQYDVIICDREDMRGIDRSFRSDTKKIFLARTIHYGLGNQKLRERYRRLQARRRTMLIRRGMQSERMPFARDADAIISVGNETASDTWKSLNSGPIYSVNNFGYREIEFRFEGKDFERTRRSFLYFAGRKQVRKGLDLLLEIFPKHPDLHLYVCSHLEKEPDFVECYRKELYETPNIHPIGWIWVNSPTFYELVQTCAYVIHPPCVEGQAGSVVQCMYAGLIPLVTREVGIDTGDFGITFADDSIEEIERVIASVSRLPARWHRERSERVRRAAEERFSEWAVAARWREMLSEIVGREPSEGRAG